LSDSVAPLSWKRTWRTRALNLPDSLAPF